MPQARALRSFGHSHAHLSELSLRLSELLQTDVADNPALREELTALALELKDELLEHFANEEEGLFPFVCERVIEQVTAVEFLQGAHDRICGALVRFSFLVEREGPLSPEAHLAFERFHDAYSEHSRDEAELLDSLSRRLTTEEQAELETLLRTLA